MPKLRDFTLLDPRAQLDKGFYDRLRAARPHYKLTERFVIPPFEGRGFIATKGQVIRVIEEEGVQIGDICFWNAHNPKEMYSLSRTWAIEGWAVRPTPASGPTSRGSAPWPPASMTRWFPLLPTSAFTTTG